MYTKFPNFYQENIWECFSPMLHIPLYWEQLCQYTIPIKPLKLYIQRGQLRKQKQKPMTHFNVCLWKETQNSNYSKLLTATARKALSHLKHTMLTRENHFFSLYRFLYWGWWRNLACFNLSHQYKSCPCCWWPKVIICFQA